VSGASGRLERGGVRERRAHLVREAPQGQRDALAAGAIKWPARLSAHETVFQDETVERTAPGAGGLTDCAAVSAGSVSQAGLAPAPWLPADGTGSSWARSVRSTPDLQTEPPPRATRHASGALGTGKVNWKVAPGPTLRDAHNRPP
jgi:hypothetical protein